MSIVDPVLKERFLLQPKEGGGQFIFIDLLIPALHTTYVYIHLVAVISLL